METRVKIFIPLVLTALLASCQQGAVPQQTAQAAAPAQGGAAQDSAVQTGTVQDADMDGGEGAEVAVPDPAYRDLSAQALNTWPTVKQGSTGDDVKAVQYLLNAHGSSLDVDSIFGSGTAAQVKSFQGQNGLTADGVVGPQTWAKLLVTVKNGSEGDAVRAVQTYLGITVDGKFGSGTDAAVKSFQSRSGLTADGVVGAQTWQALVAGTTSTVPSKPVDENQERAAILARGKVWVDAKIPYSMSKYHDGWRTDCSGFVSMAWNLRSSGGDKISATTASLYDYAHELSSPDDLKPGDAVDSSERGGATGGANHVVLFVKWIDKANHVFQSYEEKGTKYGTVAGTRTLYRSGNVWNIKGSNHTSWHFLRRNGL